LIRFLNAHFPSRTVFLGISEACLITLTFVAATIARLGAANANFTLSYQSGSIKIVVLSAVFMICMYYFDLYDSSIMGNRREVAIRFVQVLITVYAVLAVLYYLFPTLELGRGIFQIGFALVAMILWFWRRLFSAINRAPQLAERTLIFGEGPLVEQLMREFESRPELGVRVVGRVLDDSKGKDPGGSNWSMVSDDPFGTELDGNISQAVRLLRANSIIIAMGERRGKLPVGLLLSLKSRGVRVQDGTEVYEAVTGKVPVESIRLGWLLFSPGCYASRLFLFYKRLGSVLIPIIGLVVSLPLLPFIVLAIKVTSPGRILYRQKRVGRNGIVFDCYKFRTMREDAEADTGPTWAGDDDPRITPVGRFLRQSRLDEIPQLWNVLKGDMNVIGPRPERPEFVDQLNQVIPHYQFRHSVRPGITGWAQVRYKYGSSVEDAKEKLCYDIFYIKNMSVGLDLLVLFHTAKVILLGRGAK
jgi:sugar transferase (PEP-CTERM system associated)